jgi:tubby-related protein 1
LSDLARNSTSYVGKVRSNFLGTEFVFYDNGDAPEESKDKKNIRKELGAVLYVCALHISSSC